MTGLLAGLLPPRTWGAELYDTGQSLSLHPGEERHVEGAGDKRRRDFTLGRACAHAALAQLGRNEGALDRTARGAPLWPPGVTGSITHTNGYAAAIASEAWAGLGLDAERIGGVTQHLWPRLFDEAERAALASAADAPLLATLFFSAKEAAYKAWGITGLGARDMHVVRAERGFTVAHAGLVLRGRYAVDSDLLLALVWR